MRKSKILAKIRAGNAAKICAMGHFLPFFVRYGAHYGFDGIWIDLEHRAMNDREVQSLLAHCRLYDIDAMVRPASVERNRLYRYLEDGASGFLVPFTSDVPTAQKLVESTKFPPLGNRGVDGAGMDGDYGLDVWRENSTYFSDANTETFIFGQIETPDAVENVNDIAAVPGIDGLFVGPGDLGLRLSVKPRPGIKDLEAATEQVAAAAKRHGKAWGAATGSLDAIRRYRQMGAQIITRGGDFALRDVLANASSELQSALGD